MRRADKNAYALSGVDIEAADKIKSIIARHRDRTCAGTTGITGAFGSTFPLGGYQQPVLVSSCDGVGTKLHIAALKNRNDIAGIDIVHHCVNDILCQGANPLFFLDYIAMGRLVPDQVEQIVAGMAEACRGVGCALIGGETAEMPGTYCEGSYDVVGFIVGAVERQELLDGHTVVSGDVVLGLPSSGLHTNGYSLVRRVFGIDGNRAPLDRYLPQLGCTLGEELLRPHRCYYRELKDVLHLVKGLAHITGGGLAGNVPRSIPEGLGVRIHTDRWREPAVFGLIQQEGNISQEEMYRVFNMGIGMVIICGPQEAVALTQRLPETLVIGEIIVAEHDRAILT